MWGEGRREGEGRTSERKRRGREGENGKRVRGEGGNEGVEREGGGREREGGENGKRERGEGGNEGVEREGGGREREWVVGIGSREREAVSLRSFWGINSQHCGCTDISGTAAGSRWRLHHHLKGQLGMGNKCSVQGRECFLMSN